MDDVGADYLDRLIRARCGDEIADAVIPAATLEDVLALIAEMQDRIEQLEARSLPPSQSLLFN
jgi:hypothetical protein